jgi:WD40 repeat protein
LAVAVTTLDDGTVVVAAGGESRRILQWNAGTGEPVGVPLTGPKRGVMRLAFRGTRLIAADDDGKIYRWDSGEPVGDVLSGPGRPGDTPYLSVGPPGDILAVGQGGTVRRWKLSTGEDLGDVADAGCVTTADVPGGGAVLALGHTDGSITITPLPPDS